MQTIEIFPCILSLFIGMHIVAKIYSKISHTLYFMDTEKEIKCVILTIGLFLFCLTVQNKILNIITNALFFFMPIIILFKSSKKSIIYYGLIILLSSLTLSNFFNYLLCVPISKYCPDFANSPITKYVLYLLMLVIIYFIVKNRKINSELYSLYHILTINISTIVFTILSILSIYYLSLFEFSPNTGNDEKILFLFITVFFLILVIITLSVVKKYKNLKKFCSNLINNIKGNEQSFERFKLEKHNLNNFLISLQSLDKQTINKKINEYLLNNNAKNFNKNTIISTIPSGLSGFIINKISCYKNVKVIILGEKILRDINVSKKLYYNEICETVGVVLDNAFEAVSELKNKSLVIEFEETNKYLTITVYNEFNNLLKINELGTSITTTKKNGNGLGLYSISKYKHIKPTYSIINNMFRAKIRIKL